MNEKLLIPPTHNSSSTTNRTRHIAMGGIIAILLFVVAVCLFSILPPAGITVDGKIFEAVKGEGASALAKRLHNEGIIRSAYAFRVAARLSGTGASLKAGTYRLMPGANLFSVLSDIAAGRQYAVRITIPEGFTSRMIAAIFGEARIVDPTEFLAAVMDKALCARLGILADSLEGYLFPDTYWFPLKSDASAVASRMVAAFREKIARFPGAASMTPARLHEAVILASIIEREYRVPDEAPLMASVFRNRLGIGMRLQSCATVVYVLTEKMGKPHPELVTRKDLAIPDPYNTYRNAGLPPGPISNPGLTALEAVFLPVKTPYFYFRLTDPATGSHRFSKTLDEHIDTGFFIVKKPGK